MPGCESADLVKGIRGELKSVEAVIGVGAGHSFPEDYDDLVTKFPDKGPGVKSGSGLYLYDLPYKRHHGRAKGLHTKTQSQSNESSQCTRPYPTCGGRSCPGFLPRLHSSFTTDMFQNHVLRGIPTVLLSKFDEVEMLSTIERERITLAYVIESTFDRLIGYPDLEKFDLSSLRYLYATSTTKDASSRIKEAKAAEGVPGKVLEWLWVH